MEGNDLRRKNMHIYRKRVFLSLSLAVFMSPLFVADARTVQSEAYISVQAHSSGSTITSTSNAYGDASHASTSVVVVVNGETVVDIQRTSGGEPIRVEAMYPPAHVRSETSFGRSNVHITSETVPNKLSVRDNDLVHVQKDVRPLLAPLNDIDQTVEQNIIQLTDEVRDSISGISEGIEKVDTPFVAPLWTHMILSFARTMTYVTSFLFL
jgi:hypothetical protein